MNDLLSAINQILDGLGVSAGVGQFIVDAIAFLVNDLPGYIETAIAWLTETFGGLGS